MDGLNFVRGFDVYQNWILILFYLEKVEEKLEGRCVLLLHVLEGKSGIEIDVARLASYVVASWNMAQPRRDYVLSYYFWQWRRKWEWKVEEWQEGRRDRKFFSPFVTWRTWWNILLGKSPLCKAEFHSCVSYHIPTLLVEYFFLNWHILLKLTLSRIIFQLDWKSWVEEFCWTDEMTEEEI